MRKILLLSFLTVLLFGCKTTGTYEQTSLELTGLELIEPHWGYHKSWAPLGSKDGYDMTDAQKEQQIKSLNQCVKKLKNSHTNKPTHALRSVQLISCMESFGWHLVVEELFITT
ncbi:hypothetical protein [Colwellia sp. RSH04]|uniref:hypothetical protein n=1 Tax=Colwellia sp. RSH04 TaxID=2305464 RepID=UPI000E56FBA9|nr:hypothetical protein [Colwellia sp. RSH04]RHW75355.1 hypothetical protein D1094_13995 [Colwellia sp. RSH04]